MTNRPCRPQRPHDPCQCERVVPPRCRPQRPAAATLHEAGGRIGVMPREIRPVAAAFRVCGPALTVHSPGGDNLWLHRALYVARPGDVLVVHASGVHDHGYWGEIMSAAAKARRLAGRVIDACERAGAMLETAGFPVFARGLCVRGTGKDFGATGWINHPLLFGDLCVDAGDRRRRRRRRRGPAARARGSHRRRRGQRGPRRRRSCAHRGWRTDPESTTSPAAAEPAARQLLAESSLDHRLPRAYPASG